MKGPTTMKLAFGALLVTIGLIGCAVRPTASDISGVLYRVGKAWQLDNQRAEDEYRYRVIDAKYADVYEATRRAFLALGLPVQVSSVEKGLLLAENVAPAPLTKEEWLQVKEIEAPRLKEIAGLDVFFLDDPKDFTITVRTSLQPLDNRTIVMLDYVMDSPKLRTYGIVPSPHAPPSAVALGAKRFWNALRDELNKMNIPSPRKRTKGEYLA